MKHASALLVLASCAQAPPPAMPPPPDPAVLRRETLEVLATLERTFYDHWGDYEKAAVFARIGASRAPHLRELADANGEHALGAMRALARLAPAETFTVEAKAILYVTALGRERNFTRWGVISRSGFLPGVYGAELLALKAASLPYLRKLLTDTRRARVFGGEGERTNAAQGDRVCDYAWVFLVTILDRPLGYHPEPDRRDPQIRDFDLWLDRRR